MRSVGYSIINKPRDTNNERGIYKRVRDLQKRVYMCLGRTFWWERASEEEKP